MYTLCVCYTAKTLLDVYDSCGSHGGTLQVASGMSHHFSVCILPIMYLVNVIQRMMPIEVVTWSKDLPIMLEHNR